MRLVTAEQLIEFVLNDTVDSTNNLSERQLRSSALARKAARQEDEYRRLPPNEHHQRARILSPHP